MLAIPTTTISVLRGTSVNQWGDEVDDPTTHLRGVPASLLEQTRTVIEADSSTPMTVRMTTGRVGAGTDVASGDRVKDETTGTVYTVQSLTSNANPFSLVDIRMDLKQVS